jgi:2-polyprenyl-6-methoxyphenol hydroxylase-like FAD-dependent oxidoreductase
VALAPLTPPEIQKDSIVITTLETPVLIVGGGPVGLALAIDLGWRGIECLVVEQGDGTVDHPRLGAIMTRTMELARRWGIADRIYNCGFNGDYNLDVVYCTSMSGFLLARDAFPSCNSLQPPPQSPEKRQRCPQIWFNPILERAATEYDTVSIRHHHRLETFRESTDGVVADVRNTLTGEPLQIRAQYLVACDGAASEVRNALGVPMLGNPALSYSINLFIRSPTMLSSHKLGEAERYIFVGPTGTWGNLTVVDGRELWRITVIGSRTKVDLASFDAEAAVRACLGTDTIPFELLSVKPWRRTELIAKQFSVGRVFLAGDAAHTMSPTGGFGMNTGLADAADLGWKLEASLRGWAGPRLLSSYGEERQPVAARAASVSAMNFQGWVSANARDCSRILDDTPEGKALRKDIGAHMSKACFEEWDCLGIQLGYRYDNSSICIPDGTPAPPDSASIYEQTSRPGARAPHAWIKPGRSTIDLFGRGFVLLCLGADPGDLCPLVAAAAKRGMPLEVIGLPQQEIASLYENRFVLVRPDGHTAWRGDSMPVDTLNVVDTAIGR